MLKASTAIESGSGIQGNIVLSGDLAEMQTNQCQEKIVICQLLVEKCLALASIV